MVAHAAPIPIPTITPRSLKKLVPTLTVIHGKHTSGHQRCWIKKMSVTRIHVTMAPRAICRNQRAIVFPIAYDFLISSIEDTENDSPTSSSRSTQCMPCGSRSTVHFACSVRG